MVVLGLTGGIACGKSTVAQWLRDQGARVIDADVIARELVGVGSQALLEIMRPIRPSNAVAKR